MYLTNFFHLKRMPEVDVQFGYNGFGHLIYYLHYSRLIRNQHGEAVAQENWIDTVKRVTDGVMSIRKNHYKNNRIHWDEDYWQDYASGMARSMARMEWLPPGRGLWAMGTDLIRERGGMALYNCCYTDIGPDWVEDVCWIMDLLMYGCGVGFGPKPSGIELYDPSHTEEFCVPDSREGWVDSVRKLLNAFLTGGALPIFDYSDIRLAGEPIITFGGIASGPKSLKQLHERITDLCYRHIQEAAYSELKFKTDLANLVGVCVITGNVRRSAEIALGEMPDFDEFMTLKNYEKNQYRSAWGWMSNNSVLLRSRGDFENIDEIALANIQGHDVGYLNLRNVRHGRIGKHDDVPVDQAEGLNPCGEIPLESREVCNLAETLPTRCATERHWYKACEYATFYASTVTLLPTHQPATNAVINRNRRIGISIIGVPGWKYTEGVCKITRYLREGYKIVRETNARLAKEAGIPVSIRCTTIKPGGTVPKLVGCTNNNPTFKYTRRRINVRTGSPIERVLMQANIPHEPSVYTPGTTVFSYPIEQGPAPPATEVSIWEQAMMVVLLQREWADNAVSNTLYFKPKWELIEKGNLSFEGGEYYQNAKTLHAQGVYKNEGYVVGGKMRITINPETDDYQVFKFNPDHEEEQLEPVLAAIAPLTKSISLLPHTAQGVYEQMPEEEMSVEDYTELCSQIKPIEWQNYFGGDGRDEKYCTKESCS